MKSMEYKSDNQIFHFTDLGKKIQFHFELNKEITKWWVQKCKFQDLPQLTSSLSINIHSRPFNGIINLTLLPLSSIRNLFFFFYRAPSTAVGRKKKERIKEKALFPSGYDRMNVKIQLRRERNNCRFDLGRLSGVTHTPTWLTAWGTPAQSSNCCFWHRLSLQHGWGFWRADGRSSAVCLNPACECRH